MSQFSLGVAEEAVIEDAKLKLDLARERLADLAIMGLTPAWLDQFQASIQACEALPTDLTLLHTQKTLTAHKDDLLKQIDRWGHSLRDRCKFAFGHTAYNPFPLSAFRAALTNESKMIQVLPGLISLATQHTAALAVFGQPADYPSQGQVLRDQLDQLNRQQEKAKCDRKVATDRRRQAMRRVYDQLCHLNAVARAVYRKQPPIRDLFKSLAPRASDRHLGILKV